MTPRQRDDARGEALAAYYDTRDTSGDLENARLVDNAIPLDEVMIVTSLRLPQPVMELLRARATQRGMKPTALIRELIEAEVGVTDVASVPVSVILAAVAEYQLHRAS